LSIGVLFCETAELLRPKGWWVDVKILDVFVSQFDHFEISAKNSKSLCVVVVDAFVKFVLGEGSIVSAGIFDFIDFVNIECHNSLPAAVDRGVDENADLGSRVSVDLAPVVTVAKCHLSKARHNRGIGVRLLVDRDFICKVHN
jgi:hypothetical protein